MAANINALYMVKELSDAYMEELSRRNFVYQYLELLRLLEHKTLKIENICKYLYWKPSEVKNVIRRGVEYGLIRKVGTWRFTLTNKGFTMLKVIE